MRRPMFSRPGGWSIASNGVSRRGDVNYKGPLFLGALGWFSMSGDSPLWLGQSNVTIQSRAACQQPPEGLPPRRVGL
ncbi:MAG: hypothetical protein N2C14_14955, partial [Planctomycetales bacterium]